MRNMPNRQMPDGAIVRTLITVIVMTGWMVVTGCAYLKQSDAYSKQATVCFDKGRSGYWCPSTATAVASEASTTIDKKISD